MSSSTDPYAGDGGSNRNPDVPPRLDAAPGQCETNWVSAGTGKVLKCLDATLDVPRTSVRTGADWPVTLSLWSKDGILSLPDGNDTWRDYGTNGPIYSIYVEDKYIENPVTLRIRAIPPSPVPPERFRLAYVDTDSKCWITTEIGTYYTGTNEVEGTVTVNKPGMHYFTPVETCAAGAVCDFNLKCKGEACQK